MFFFNFRGREKDRDATPADTQIKSLPIRQFLLGNLFTPEGQKAKKFRVPLDVLGKALANMGDFPYKDPGKARFEKPALFVRGTKSKYVPDEVLPAVGEFFPRFEVVDVEAGHWLISENPEAFRQGEFPGLFLQKLLFNLQGVIDILNDANMLGSCCAVP